MSKSEVNSSSLSRVERLIREQVLGLKAYQIADATGMIKLDAMENPYTWPDELRQQWLKRLEQAELNRYPDPKCTQLSETIRQVFGVSKDKQVLLGNGSDELIQIIINAVAKPGATVMSFSPGFVMYEFIAIYNRLQYAAVPLSADFDIPLAETLAQIARYQPAVIFIAYPNNPTGNLFDQKAIRTIIESAPGLVVIDEAYTSFAKTSFLEQLDNYENMLVLRTLSKMGLAGLRLGYLIGAAAWLDQLDKVRLPYNINILTQISAQFALENKSVLDSQTDLICQQRERLYQDMKKIDSLSIYQSQANFLMFRTAPGQAAKIHQRLLEQQVLIKNLSPAGGSLADCLRVTVGTEDENRLFLAALAKSL